MRKIEPWPLGLGIFITLFVIVTVVVVLVISRERPDMVTSDYYDKDLHFQTRYEMLERTQALTAKPVAAYDAALRACTLQFPDSTAAARVSGSVRFFRISDRASDVTRKIALGRDGRQTFADAHLGHGAWLMQVSWNEGGKEYYIEERIYVN